MAGLKAGDLLYGYPRKLVNDFLDSTIAVNLNNDAAEKGQLFQGFHKVSIAAGASLDLTFTTPADKDILLFPINLNTSGDKITLEVYEGATVADGTAVTPTCQNRQLDKVSTSVLKVAPTVSVVGTQIAQAWLPGSTGTGQTRSGGSSGGDTIWKLKRGTTYINRLVNGSTAANVAQMNVIWVERDI